ncbi:hypothetical protein Taro_022852 [Colocasia esculenta]|uniref:acid phosphatase n=1 Tax=Colocasia esculenta TaxID=4460 RepID=A0A843V2D9_COLES|nr:hypothetical protein [Colocasia esculenta]
MLSLTPLRWEDLWLDVFQNPRRDAFAIRSRLPGPSCRRRGSIADFSGKDPPRTSAIGQFGLLPSLSSALFRLSSSGFSLQALLWAFGLGGQTAGMAANAVVRGINLAVVGLSLCFVSSLAKLPRVEHHAGGDGALSLLVVGDWGRKGLFNQSEVAMQMGKIGEHLDIDFVISTGDNFYEDGLTGVDDGAFHDSFTNVYTAKSLQKPWYSVLGNHDYRGDAIAQLSPALKKIDSRWVCMRSFVLDAGVAQFFFVDTTPFVLEYWNEVEEHNYDWRQVAPREQYVGNLLKELDSALAKSSARWKFVVGHHTMRSASEHGDTEELVEELLPVLKARKVDLYINGHDHCLEHVSSQDSPLQFLTSGGGSKAWRGVYEPNADKLRFFYDGQGFLSLQVCRTRVQMAFYDVQGNVLYRWSTGKELGPSA